MAIDGNTMGPKWQFRNLWALLLAQDNSAPYLFSLSLYRAISPNNKVGTENYTVQ